MALMARNPLGGLLSAIARPFGMSGTVPQGPAPGLPGGPPSPYIPALPGAYPSNAGFTVGTPGFGTTTGGAPPGLEAGGIHRRLMSWRPSSDHVNSLLANAGDTVLARARWLNRNNPYAKAALRSWRAASVGAGIKPSSLIEEQTTRERVNAAWLAFTDEADAENITDLYGLERRVSAEVFLAGECFVRLRPRLPEDGLTVPLQLQLLPAEQLPMHSPRLEASANPIRLGIEFDRIMRDKRVAYWFRNGNPNDATLSFQDALQAGKLTRVPAEQIIHVFDPQETGQIRGLTSYGAAMVRMFHLDLYDDAELERKKQQARYAAIITSTNDENMAVQSALDDIPIAPYGPGAYVQLAPGETVEFSPPGEVGGSYEPFQFRNLLAIAAALGIPYHELSGDLTKANYASSRAGLVAYRSDVEAFQHAVLVFQFLRRVWQVWMDAAVIAGVLPFSATAYRADMATFRAAKFITPKWNWVDPWKDAKAEALMVSEGFKSRGDVVESLGEDVEQLDRRIAEDNQRAKELGLQFPVPVVRPDAMSGTGGVSQAEGGTESTPNAGAEDAA
jgi:lambda family phage portal protein